MIKSIKRFICNLFNIKACKCKNVPEPEVMVYEEKQMHCGSHVRYRKSCPACVATIN